MVNAIGFSGAATLPNAADVNSRTLEDAAPIGVNSTLWFLSSVEERANLLSEASTNVSPMAVDDPGELIIVVGGGGGPGPGEVGPGSGTPGTGGDAGGASGGTSDNDGYNTSGASADANKFAAEHVKLESFNAYMASFPDYTRARDNIAKFYDFASANPAAIVDLGFGKKMPALEALSDLRNVAIKFTNNSSLSGNTGARNVLNPDGKGITVYINPDNENIKNYDKNFSGASDEDYLLFHELGHSLNYFKSGSNAFGAEFSSEAAANTAGRSLQNAIGRPLLNKDGVPAVLSDGYA